MRRDQRTGRFVAADSYGEQTSRTNGREGQALREAGRITGPPNKVSPREPARSLPKHGPQQQRDHWQGERNGRSDEVLRHWILWRTEQICHADQCKEREDKHGGE